MKYELVIFDLDGTLLDTTEGIIEAVKHTIETHKLKESSNEKLLSFIGPPIQESFIANYGVSKEKAQLLANDFRKYYSEESLLMAIPYPGIYETIDAIVARGIKVAVATYKREDYAVRLLKHYGFDKYTDMLYGADNDNKLRKSDIIQKCIDVSRVNSLDKVLMVGDSAHDEKGAAGIGVDFVGVTYGFGYKNRDEVINGMSIGACDTTGELLSYL